MTDRIIENLFSFLEKSPTAFHAARQIGSRLDKEGYRRLSEQEPWKLEAGGNYYVSRNDSSIIAFQIGEEPEDYSFQIVASHSDSPAFKVKENAEMEDKEGYVRLNTEGYGGMVCSSWLDRPLSVAGRAVVKTQRGLETRLVHIDRDLLLIPGLAIHMNRKANEGASYNLQVDMLPVLGESGKKGSLRRLIADSLKTAPERIYGMDLFVYNRMKGTVWGAEEEYLSAPRLDDLECAYASLEGFLQGHNRRDINVYVCFDNEEVGSATKQGAGSTFLYDTLSRIGGCLGRSREDYLRAVASGFLLSVDNAHAVHPNHPEKSDPTNGVYMNRGIVIKQHAGQKYTSDGISAAAARLLFEQAGVPIQYFSNRSDEPGGSTLGNVSAGKVSLNTADIGLAQLAMHSSYETAGRRDVEYLLRAMKQFYRSGIHIRDGLAMLGK